MGVQLVLVWNGQMVGQLAVRQSDLWRPVCTWGALYFRALGEAVRCKHLGFANNPNAMGPDAVLSVLGCCEPVVPSLAGSLRRYSPHPDGICSNGFPVVELHPRSNRGNAWPVTLRTPEMVKAVGVWTNTRNGLVRMAEELICRQMENSLTGQ